MHWRSVAAGWERQGDLFARATAVLSARMIELLDPRPGQTVLEIAAGPGATGIPARCRGSSPAESSSRPTPRPRWSRSPGAAPPSSGSTGVSFAVEDAANLSFDDDSVDAILCRFGIMLVPEMERTTAEMARVLRPGGRAVLAVWASSRVNPWMTAPGRAALELGLTDPPDLEAPGPFRLADPEQLRSVVESGGLEIEVVEDVPVTWEADSLGEWWDVVRDTSRMLTLLLERLSDEETTALRRASEAHLEEYVARDGSLTVPGVARVVQAIAATH